MNKKNMILGIGMGLAVGGLTALAMKPRKRSMKTTVGKTLKTMSDVVESVSDALGL